MLKLRHHKLTNKRESCSSLTHEESMLLTIAQLTLYFSGYTVALKWSMKGWSVKCQSAWSLHPRPLMSSAKVAHSTKVWFPSCLFT